MKTTNHIAKWIQAYFMLLFCISTVIFTACNEDKLNLDQEIYGLGGNDEQKNELDKWIKSGSAAVVIVGGAVSVKFKSFVPFGISLAIVIVAIMGLLVSNKSRSNDKTNINLLFAV